MTFRNALTSVAALATGTAGTSRLTIGAAVPTGLAGNSAAIVFYQSDGSYLALTTIDNGGRPNLSIYYAASDAAPPVRMTNWSGHPASPGLDAMTIDQVIPLHLVRTLITLNASWVAAGGAAPAYQVDATGWVELQGKITNPGAIGTGAAITGASLPAPVDAAVHDFGVFDEAVAATRLVQLSAAGGLSWQGPASGGGDVIVLDGIGYQS